MSCQLFTCNQGYIVCKEIKICIKLHCFMELVKKILILFFYFCFRILFSVSFYYNLCSHGKYDIHVHGQTRTPSDLRIHNAWGCWTFYLAYSQFRNIKGPYITSDQIKELCFAKISRVYCKRKSLLIIIQKYKIV